MPKIILCLLLLAFFFVNLKAQDSSGVLQQLLDLPSPAAFDSENYYDRNSTVKDPNPEEFYSRLTPPPDDAPLEPLLQYWFRQSKKNESSWNKMIASEKTAQRILEYCKEDPAWLDSFITALPDSPDIIEMVEAISEKAKAEGYSLSIDDWLKIHSKKFTNELVEDIQDVNEKDDYLNKMPKLLSLARLDWDRAEPFVEILSAEEDKSPLATLALGMRYEHALKLEDKEATEKYRKQLTATADDKKVQPTGRELAFMLLTRCDWEGLDEWIMSFFEDETLLSSNRDKDEDGELGFRILQHIRENPNKFIPMIAKIINHQNPAVHNNAVNCLLGFDYYNNPRKDVFVLLLPLLSNPDWIKDKNGSLRDHFIESLSREVEILIPESIPGLIWVVANDENPGNRAYAAKALAKYKNREAIPALWKALKNESVTIHLNYIIEGLISSGGLSEEEMIDAMESFALATSTSEGYKNVFEREDEYSPPLPVKISIGRYLCETGNESESFGALFLDRIDKLERTKPEIAKKLLSYMTQWKAEWTRAAVLRRIAENKADLEAILTALAERKLLFERFAPEIYSLSGRNSIARGIGAALLADNTALQSVLGGNDIGAKIALLACARMIRLKLPVEETSQYLKDKNNLLALAAERYLISEDSPAAQSLILNEHEGEAFITGSRDSFNPLEKSYSDHSKALEKLFRSVHPVFEDYPLTDSSFLKKREERLRRELQEESGPQEIYSFLFEYYYAAQTIKIYPQKAVFSYQKTASRTFERELTEKELEAFHSLINQIKIENLSADIQQYGEGVMNEQYEFIALNRNGGRRVYYYSMGRLGPFEELSKLFTSFRESGKFKLHYFLQDKIKDLKVLLADDNLLAEAVWKKGDNLRVLVKREIESLPTIEGESDESRRQRELDVKDTAYSWQKINKAGMLGEVVKQPAEVPFLRDESEVPELLNLNSDNRAWQVRIGNEEIRSGKENNAGLWKVSRDYNPIQIAKGDYNSPLVSPDEKWIVAAKKDEGANYSSQYLIRFNLQTGQEEKININPAWGLAPIVFVPEKNRFLIFRRYSGDSEPMYFWLNMETKKVQEVKGEIRPLKQQTYRPLQQAKQANTYWAAIPDRNTNSTEVGIYNAKTLSFKAVIKLPEIQFNSMDMWVDETDNSLSFIYEGDLLSLPLPKEK